MAKYTFSVESDDLHEVASFITSAAGAVDPVMDEIKETPAAKAAPKASRGKKADPEPAPEEHPMLKAATLGDIKEKASQVLGKGGNTGAEMMTRLKDRFGVESFSALKAEDYDRCLAMLDEL